MLEPSPYQGTTHKLHRVDTAYLKPLAPAQRKCRHQLRRPTTRNKRHLGHRWLMVLAIEVHTTRG